MLKSELRNKYLNLRKSLSGEDVKEISSRICDDFFKTIDISNTKLLHVFLPIQKFNEVDTWLIIKKLWKDFPHIKTVTSIVDGDNLKHVLFDQDTIYEYDNWGIPIPMGAHEIDLKELEVAIIPLLAYDKNNQRVGYGKGYYDKFLSKCTPHLQKVGVSLYHEVEVIDDLNKYDVPLNIVLS